MLPHLILPYQTVETFAGKRRVVIMRGQDPVTQNTPKGTQPPLAPADIERLLNQANNNKEAKHALNKAKQDAESLRQQLEAANKRADTAEQQLSAAKKQLINKAMKRTTTDQSKERHSRTERNGMASSATTQKTQGPQSPKVASGRAHGLLSAKQAERFLEDLMADRGYKCASCDFPTAKDVEAVTDPKAFKPLFTYAENQVSSLGPSQFQLKLKPLQQHTRQDAAAEAARQDVVCFTCKEEATRYPTYYKNKRNAVSVFPGIKDKAVANIKQYANKQLAGQSPVPTSGKLTPPQAKIELLRIFGNECNACHYPPPEARALMPGGLLARLLQFHHKVPAEKSFTISNTEIKKRDFAEVLEEAARKCILLCANCHNMAHKTPELLKNRLDIRGKSSGWL
jgi:hypothetical protein